MATAVSGQKMAGCVKWFNMKTGFGFLTVVRGGGSGELKVGSEVFVHHSNVKVQEEQYRFWCKVSTWSLMCRMLQTASILARRRM